MNLNIIFICKLLLEYNILRIYFFERAKTELRLFSWTMNSFVHEDSGIIMSYRIKRTYSGTSPTHHSLLSRKKVTTFFDFCIFLSLLFSSNQGTDVCRLLICL